MDQYLNFIIEKKVEKTIASLKKNRMNGYFVQNRAAALEKIKELVTPGQKVAVGGSKTLLDIGAIDLFRNGEYDFIDLFAKNITPEEQKNKLKQGLLADVFVTGTNALTEEGELYNVDGAGNRIAAMNYGPDKVIVVVGINKLTEDLDDAVKRVKRIASPVNSRRLQRQNPCTITGFCSECASPERLCNLYSIIRKQRDPGRLHVIIVNEELGY